MNVTLTEFFTYLITEKNFYARIANGFQRILRPKLGTLAVGIRGGRVCFYYDPEFIQKVSMGFGLFALEHEMIHIAMDHIPRFLELLATTVDPDERAKMTVVYNIAMDCAVHSMMRKHKHFELAKEESKAMARWRHPGHVLEGKENDQGKSEDISGICLPEKYGLPLEGSFEFYQRELMKQVQLIKLKFKGAGGKGVDGKGDEGGEESGQYEFEKTGDEGLDQLLEKIAKDLNEQIGQSHSLWQDEEDKETPDFQKAMPEELQGLAERIRGQAKQILKKAVHDQKKSRGLIPGEVAEWLDDYLSDPVVPWWDVMTTRIKATKRSKPDRGISRPNRTLLALAEEDASIIPALGKLRDPRFRIFFYVDTSGSQSTEELKIGASELTHLLASDEDLELRYMQGDAETKMDLLLKSGDKVPDEAVGRGGTDFNAYFAYMNQYVGNDETHPDIVVVYTDGWAPSVDPDVRLPDDIPVIWLLTPRHSAEHLKGYGEIIVCDPDQNEMWQYQE